MYGNRTWGKTSFWFIPISILWALLDMWVNDSYITRKLVEKHPEKKRFIRNCIYVGCACIAFVVVFGLLYIIRELTGIDLTNL